MGNLTVMLVEDNNLQRDMFSAWLEGQQIDVFGCATAAQASDRLKEGGIDLVVCDLMLPDPLHPKSDPIRNGIGAIVSALKAGLPTVVITAWGAGFYRERVTEHRSDDEAMLLALPVMTKPFTQTDLVAVITRELSNKRG